MTNLIITNKKVQYTVKSESTNFKIEGIVTINDINSVLEYTGTISKNDVTITYLGNFSFNQNNVYVNLQQEKELISEVSQLVTDTIGGVETQLKTIV